MSDAENLRLVHRWQHLYDRDVHQCLDECYADGFVVIVPGLLTITDRTVFHAIEQTVLDAAPDRVMHIDETVPVGDRVIVRARVRYTDHASSKPMEGCFCSILRILEGKITEDITYLDRTTFCGIRELHEAGLLAEAPAAKPARQRP
ncbi:nuclear transport factor 2 family protein [Kitasatospora sp. NPDC059463]|uniref:nuclear transport factor 2 family protein n=1 Tax=unclassified Kitasatospora TaxID=2633591 RepID=UPI003698F626